MKRQKVKDIFLFVVAMLIALSMLYIVILKAKYLIASHK